MTTETPESLTFDISIRCDNAAFDGADCGPELARILMALAHDLRDDCQFERAGYYVALRDSNGNTVGTAELVRS